MQSTRQNDDALKSQAYLAYNDWGPSGVEHRKSELADVCLQVSRETRLAWIEEFKKIDKEIWNGVSKGQFKERERAKFFEHMRGRFPFMNQAALERAWFLYGY